MNFITEHTKLSDEQKDRLALEIGRDKIKQWLRDEQIHAVAGEYIGKWYEKQYGKKMPKKLREKMDKNYNAFFYCQPIDKKDVL